ncbi:MAG: type II toxin-antitoxin system VapC family toxin [Candidatus Poribacteria bacterium]
MSDIGAVEVVASLARRGRDGDGILPDFEVAIAEFCADFDARWRIVPTTPRLLARAREAAVTHFLRGYDAVHLAAAVESSRVVEEMRGEGLIFVSADVPLNAGATAEGLRVVDPTERR